MSTLVPALGLLVVALVATSPLAAGSSPPPVLTVPGAWASYDTGRVSVVLPAALPQVELFQDANSSLRATLQIDQIVELSPGGLPHPRIVAAAFAAGVHTYNGSSAQNASSWPLSLSAELAVRPVNSTLWGSSGLPIPLQGGLGVSILTITYAPANNRSTTSGVAVNWSVSSWPWVAPTDLLAIEFHFSLSAGRQLTACSGPDGTETASTGCMGTALATNGISWGSSYTGLVGAGGSGPMAAVDWNTSARLPWGAAVPYTVGTYDTGNGTAEVLLGAAAHGASLVTGSVDFQLVAPAGSVLATVEGEPFVFGGTVVAGTVASVTGLLLYRRRDRRLRDAL